ncbi:MAG: DUF3078 domain-containing protein [Bacteroidales bacterium]|nr:DUF3078 domain-containing protein [Bacteroidales bacterium]
MATLRVFVVAFLLLIVGCLKAQTPLIRLLPQYDTIRIDTTEQVVNYYLLPHQTFETNSVIGVGPLLFIPKYIPSNATIAYAPKNVANEQIENYQQFILGVNPTYESYLSKADKMVEKIAHDYTVDSLAAIKYVWNEIPEPWRDITERRKRKGQESDDSRKLAKYFRDDNDYSSRNDMVTKPEAEKSPWTVSGQENIQLTQLAVCNWVKGGENSITILNDFRYKAVFNKGRHSWESNFTEKLGFTRTSTLSTRVSDDAFEITSKYGYNAVKKWYYSFQCNFKTQMFRSYSRSDAEKTKPLSTLLSPAYIQFIFGMDYKKDDLSILLSPYTGMLTVVADTADIDQTLYSIDEDKRSKYLNGYSVTVNWKKAIAYNVTYTTQCELFLEFVTKEGQKQFNWENIFDVQINRFLTTRFLLTLRYYDNESNKFQLKENYSIAFKYTFS